MVQVKISYNIYRSTMSIYIDGRPIPPVSRLTRFQSSPFGYWCADILQAIAEEVNDQFSLVYTGRPCESRILGGYMAQVPQCASYSNCQPELSDSALTRLKRLSSLCQSGASCDRFNLKLRVYTEFSPEQVQALVTGCLPKLTYCRITADVHPLQELARHPDDSPAFILTGTQPQVPNLAGGVCVLTTAPGSGGVLCRNNCFLEHTKAELLEIRIRDYLELLLYPYVLRKALGNVRVPESSPLFPSVTVLDKIEPQTIVTLPTSVEFGQTAPVKVRTVPESAVPARLVYRVSDESVVRVTDSGIQGVGTGEAVVEVYISGQSNKLASGKITAYRRNRIQKLQIQQNDIKLSVGDKVTLHYTFEPADADNESAIRLVSSDGTVAAPERGTTFVARKPGSCRMVLQADQITADVNVRVYPRLEGLKLELSTEKMRTGDLVPVRVTRIPEDATLDKLSYTVSPESLGTYDVSTRNFCPKSSGTGTFTVSARGGSVKASCPIEIRPGKSKGGGGCLFTVLMSLSAFGAMALMLMSLL